MSLDLIREHIRSSHSDIENGKLKIDIARELKIFLSSSDLRAPVLLILIHVRLQVLYGREKIYAVPRVKNATVHKFTNLNPDTIRLLAYKEKPHNSSLFSVDHDIVLMKHFHPDSDLPLL